MMPSCVVRRVQINGENVSTASHGRTVQLIRNSGDAICLKIVTPARRPSLLDRPRLQQQQQQQPKRLVVAGGVSCQQQAPPRPSTASGGPTSRQHRAQRLAAAKTSSASRDAHLSSARSMPDLTVAEEATPAHRRRYHIDGDDDDDDDAPVNDAPRRPRLSFADYRDRVLCELTNRLGPSSAVRHALPLGVASAAQRTDDDTAASGSILSVKPASDESTRRGPAPPPRGTSLSSRLPASEHAAAGWSAGSELKQLLVISGGGGGHDRTSDGRVHQHNYSPSTEARSTVSGEHLVLPSQLKKLKRSPTNDQATKPSKEDDGETGRRATASGEGGDAKLNGHSSVVAQQNAASEPRLPVPPKRPAPPPPSATRLTTPSPTNGEVNFLVMAEQARKQYILSKLATGSLAACKTAGNSSARPANDKQTADSKRANDRELQKEVNGLINYAETAVGCHLIANGESMDRMHRPTSNELRIQSSSSPQADDRDLRAGRTTEQALNHSRPLESLFQSTQQLSESTETLPTGPSPVIPPKRRPRHISRVAVCNNKTSNSERLMTSNIDSNGTNGVLQSHVSTHELSDTKLSENSAANMTTQENIHTEDSSEHERKSNAKLTRGKNVVVIRRSRLSQMMTMNGEHQSTSVDKSCDDANQIQQLASMCDVGVLPPPPDFAD